MNLKEIKNAVKSGQTVHWRNTKFRVIQGNPAFCSSHEKQSVTDENQYLIICDKNQEWIPLTHSDGVTINGKLEEFFLDAPEDETSQLRAIEEEIRALSVQVWAMTVDDPDTATIESEAEKMTPGRIALRALQEMLSRAAEVAEQIVNHSMISTKAKR